MRHVTKATNQNEANLIACQVKYNIYFYTTTCIQPNCELIVDYSDEFTKRIQKCAQQLETSSLTTEKESQTKPTKMSKFN